MFQSKAHSRTRALLLLVLITATAPTLAEMTAEVKSLQKQWADINYHVAHDDKADRYAVLLSECEVLTKPEHAGVEGIIWCGIVKSSYAGYVGGLSALKYAKMARSDFERAIEMDGQALKGSAYTSLGTLYSKVPGWPLGFGNDKTAREMLLKGIELNPEGIDSNYFYAEFLYDEGHRELALEYLAKARQAAPRPGREVADAGRQEEIAQLLKELES